MASKITPQRLCRCGIMAVVRSDDPTVLVEVGRAIARGGVDVIEVTFTVPDALRVISETRKALDDEIVVGAGTVLDPETARAAILAGAEFIVSPTLNVETIALCNRYGVPVVPGAFTPTEILTAYTAGADLVKVFPATKLGPEFIKDMAGPLPHIPLVPTGGVNLDNAAQFIRAGAACLGVGSNLVEKEAIKNRDFDRLTANAEKFVAVVREARGG